LSAAFVSVKRLADHSQDVSKRATN